MRKYYRKGITLVSLLFVAFLAFSSSVFADNFTINIVEAPSCTFGMSSGGTYARSMDNGETAVIVANNITTSCNDASGYAIYAIGFSGDTYGDTDLISTLNTNYNIKTDGTGTYGSSWKMKITAVTNATVEGSYSSFQNIPSTYAKVASYNTSTTEGTITPSYQINISNTQIADTYTGKVKYTLVHPASAAVPDGSIEPLNPTDCPANSICYAPNYSDIIGDMSSLGAITSSAKAGKQTTITGLGGGSSITSSTTAILLVAPNYSRPGYGFAGWSEDLIANNNSTIYGPNETVTITAGSLDTNGMILYPVWVASAGDMQEWSGCSGLTAATYDSTTGKVSATLNQITALTDTRDGNVYTVAKLADGKCWMVENLRLNNEHTTSSTDIAKAQGYNTYSGIGTDYGDFIGLASSEDKNFTSTNPTAANNNTNDYYSSDNSTIININNSGYPAYRIPRYNNNNTNTSDNATNSRGLALADSVDAENSRARWYGYGNYYNWPAAMASTKYGAMDTSICPKGWEPPLGYKSTGTLADGANDAANRVGGFSYLDRIMGGTGQSQTNVGGTAGSTQSKKWRSFPNNFVFSGMFISDSASERGSYGYYWSRTASDAMNVYVFQLYSSNINTGTSAHSKYYGDSLRCIAQ